MTILPNKKPSKEKNENENKEHYGSHGSSDGRPSRRSPPPTQRNSLPQREAVRTSVLDSGAGIDEFATHEVITKKRHRLSPHRSSRKQRSSVEKERGNSSKSVSLASFNAGSPSFSGSTSRLSYRNPPAITSSSSSSHEELDDDAENPEGYNSGDEYGPREFPEDADELELRFERALKEKRGYIIKKVGQDGACLFRAVADQVFGDEEHNVIVRRDCIEYMTKNADYFKQFVTEDFNEYLKRKRKPNAHGNYVEMQAMCEMYNRPIEIYQYSLDPINIFHCAYETDNEPIRLSYHRNIHYNSVIDPFKATIGVGLGLPGHQPGLADKTLMSDALKMSEEHDIEKTMLEDKVKETDWEVTQDAIDEQVARESYLQWLRDQEKLENSTAAPSASAACCSASTSKASSGEVRLARSPDHIAPPPFLSTADLDLGQEVKLAAVMTPVPVQSANDVAGAEAIDPDMSLHMFGLADWDDDDILEEVMRRSQAEYLDSLKKTTNAANSNVSSNSGNNAGSSGNSSSNAGNLSANNADSDAANNTGDRKLPAQHESPDFS